jgi:hypothetical protein
MQKKVLCASEVTGQIKESCAPKKKKFSAHLTLLPI